MATSDSPEDDKIVTTQDADDQGTAPDSDTQSSAASESGGRTSESGSRAPNEPAEGA
jgi:hypothetical protein